tara:strand:+ start:6603 stop:7100 length:498 start_codon:yes stop_codon:yes gene_type:complete
MGTKTICDRSGAVIEGERPEQPGDSPLSDLVIFCPWLPAVHNLRFDDLCDSERLKLSNYLLSIAKKGGKEGKPAALAEATGFTGAPLLATKPAADGGTDADKLPIVFEKGGKWYFRMKGSEDYGSYDTENQAIKYRQKALFNQAEEDAADKAAKRAAKRAAKEAK